MANRKQLNKYRFLHHSMRLRNLKRRSVSEAQKSEQTVVRDPIESDILREEKTWTVEFRGIKPGTKRPNARSAPKTQNVAKGLIHEEDVDENSQDLTRKGAEARSRGKKRLDHRLVEEVPRSGPPANESEFGIGKNVDKVNSPFIEGDAEKRDRMRKNAGHFREARREAERVIDSVSAVQKAEVARSENVGRKRTRLNHSDERLYGLPNAGRVVGKVIQGAAIPVKRYIRQQLRDADQDNVAVDAMQTGARAANLSDISRRKQNVRDAKSQEFFPEQNMAEKAAQTEKKKKEQIRAFQQKRRQRVAIATKRGEPVAATGGLADAAKVPLSIPQKAKKAAVSFFSEHKGILIGVAAAGFLFVLMALAASSCVSLIQGGGTTIVGTTYASTDEDIYAAENAFCAMEDKLNAQVNNMEAMKPGYSEYVYQIDEIGHNPYHLISYLQVRYGGFVYNDKIQSAMENLFRRQYQITYSETSETRTRMEPATGVRMVTDPETGEVISEEYQYEQEIEYEHKTLYVKLTNKGLDMAAREQLSMEQIVLYDALNRTYGNRDYLFDLDSLGPDGSSDIQYKIPPEALSDVKFANMIREAEKYLGYPYVWGGKSPRTSFDCSGFVCWVINHCANDWSVGHKRAKDLCRMCIYVSPSEARPGDLIFFEKTYNTTGASHVGIYVGDGVMLHCGDPIKYSSINTRYYKSHFLCFGRLPFYDD